MIVINTPREYSPHADLLLQFEAVYSHIFSIDIDNPVGKVFSKEELQKIGDLCVKNEIIILSDEVYDRLYYVPFTRMATLSPEIERLTLTVGSAGKNFYATGWRVGQSLPLLSPRSKGPAVLASTSMPMGKQVSLTGVYLCNNI